ncbi:hypothetical protein PBAL39_13602 [Pedobacter sp. BAL39]|nr:hypothetical protein PBAL39_13602 [Pedobacter sp. BAL39]
MRKNQGKKTVLSQQSAKKHQLIKLK